MSVVVNHGELATEVVCDCGNVLVLHKVEEPTEWIITFTQWLDIHKSHFTETIGLSVLNL